MRAAMAAAEVGDDVFGEDPTVNRLESRLAELLGKEAALFVPSGTMANQIAIRLCTQPGDEVLLGADAHPFHYEAGGAAVISGVTLRLVPAAKGVLDVPDVAAAVRAPNVHHAPAALLSVENTSNRGGGAVTSVERCDALCTVARDAGLMCHLDGARLWNASVASHAPVSAFARPFDVVNVCFSKGLGAPVGSMLCASRALVERGRRVRKMLGGGMRQAGILAAACDWALDHHVERLAEDHRRARALWEGLRAAGVDVEEAPETNIVYFRVLDAPSLVTHAGAHGVRCIPMTQTRVRLVTHLEVDDDGVSAALDVLRRLAAPG
jgi:threonine aldolase